MTMGPNAASSDADSAFSNRVVWLIHPLTLISTAEHKGHPMNGETPIPHLGREGDEPFCVLRHREGQSHDGRGATPSELCKANGEHVGPDLGRIGEGEIFYPRESGVWNVSPQIGQHGTVAVDKLKLNAEGAGICFFLWLLWKGGGTGGLGMTPGAGRGGVGGIVV